MRGDACSDCVVTFMAIPVRQVRQVGRSGGRPSEAAARAAPGMDLDDAERDAIEVLARSGLVPPLRMARAV